MPESRIFNFSAGPAVLPEPVLAQAQAEMMSLPGVGMSVLEISHRSTHFDKIHAETEENLRHLLGIPKTHRVLLLQGGASLQFSMVAANLLAMGGTADYVLTGAWGEKAAKEAKLYGAVHVAWDGKAGNHSAVPGDSELNVTPGATYLHYTSNETIQGVEFQTEPKVAVPLVCDASSDILSRPIDMSRYALLYAGAQKNMGPSGLVLVVVSDEMLGRVPKGLPAMLDYRVQAENNSLYNTPNVFGIYILGLVAKWVRSIGGMPEMHRLNQEKAGLLYGAIDASGGYYKGHAKTDCRSLMNVTFRLPSEELENRFVKEAAAKGMDGLKGHRSVGGIRASIYNAFPKAGALALAGFMRDFQAKNG